MNPAMWDLQAVVRRVATMVGLGSVDELFSKNQGSSPDPKIMKDLAEIQLKTKELASTATDNQQRLAFDELELKFKAIGEQVKAQGNKEQRESNERIAMAKLKQEQMQLGEGALIHPDAIEAARSFAQQWPGPELTGRAPGAGRVL
jgi:hypothetical protein